jgi:hypothetical protein
MHQTAIHKCMHGQKEDIHGFIATHSLAPLAHALPDPHPNVPPHVFVFGFRFVRGNLFCFVCVSCAQNSTSLVALLGLRPISSSTFSFGTVKYRTFELRSQVQALAPLASHYYQGRSLRSLLLDLRSISTLF